MNLWAGQAAALAGEDLGAREYLASLVKELPRQTFPTDHLAPGDEARTAEGGHVSP
jgi:hypothetical protein